MNKIPGIEEPYSKQILDLFKKLPKNTEAILFGSRAKGNFREGSDIDIALKGDSADLNLRDSLLMQYESLDLPWKLDIAVYDQITESALRDHIDRVGKTLAGG
jgi:predicted nucleotidyltransferase